MLDTLAVLLWMITQNLQSNFTMELLFTVDAPIYFLKTIISSKGGCNRFPSPLKQNKKILHVQEKIRNQLFTIPIV